MFSFYFYFYLSLTLRLSIPHLCIILFHIIRIMISETVIESKVLLFTSINAMIHYNEQLSVYDIVLFAF